MPFRILKTPVVTSIPVKLMLPFVTIANDIAKGRKVPMSPKDPEISEMNVETLVFVKNILQDCFDLLKTNLSLAKSALRAEARKQKEKEML